MDQAPHRKSWTEPDSPPQVGFKYPHFSTQFLTKITFFLSAKSESFCWLINTSDFGSWLNFATMSLSVFVLQPESFWRFFLFRDDSRALKQTNMLFPGLPHGATRHSRLLTALDPEWQIRVPKARNILRCQDMTFSARPWPGFEHRGCDRKCLECASFFCLLSLETTETSARESWHSETCPGFGPIHSFWDYVSLLLISLLVEIDVSRCWWSASLHVKTSDSKGQTCGQQCHKREERHGKLRNMFGIFLSQNF